MSKNVRLRKGFDINLKGKPSPNVVTGKLPETFAVKPTDFVGLHKPKVLVAEGDKVEAGQALYFDKDLEKVKFTAPVSGEVVGVVRGEKRKLLEFRIKADATTKFKSYKSYTASEMAGLGREAVVDQMCDSGLWPHLIQRPYAIIANPEETPKAIFISAFDTAPLAPDFDVLIAGEEENFKFGIEVLKRLTSGPIHVNVSADKEVSRTYSSAKGITLNKFSGPHPAGNVGVQIHHLSPIGKGDLYWTITPVGVVQLGRLFATGKVDMRKRIAVVGSEVAKPQYYETYAGANVRTYLEENLTSEHVRVISGNVLTGQKIAEDGYLGFYDNTVTVVPEGDQYQFFGSFVPTANKVSIHRAIGLFSFLNPKSKEYTLTTNINGEHRPFVQTGTFERVLPMSIYPTHLFKAILTEDFDDMEALGILEVAEEDVALCEFVDVSKHELQSIVRQGIELMRNS